MRSNFSTTIRFMKKMNDKIKATTITASNNEIEFLKFAALECPAGVFKRQSSNLFLQKKFVSCPLKRI